MRFPVSSKIALAGFVAGLALDGCGGRAALLPGADGMGEDSSGSGDATSSAAGTVSTSASGTSSGGGASGGGGPGLGGAAGRGSGGATGSGGVSGGDGASGSGGASGAGGSGGVVESITKVAPTPGCGLVPEQIPGTPFVGTIQTKGVKAPDCADSKCGPWSYLREYVVVLPLGYDSTKAYPLVFQTPGCGGTGKNGYTLNSSNSPDPSHDNVDNTVIRVGLTPPPNDIGHATNPGQGCFDESEGDDSVEWPFFEGLYDRLAGQLCFDKNRVFSNGSGSGGGRFSDELGCKYAGDAKRPIRGVISNSGDWATSYDSGGGGLIVEPKYAPTCTTRPMAGMWVHELGDTVRPWASTKVEIARAMIVDRCPVGKGYDDAKLENFPIGGGNFDNTCKRIVGCSELTPLVVCPINGTQHSSHDSIVNPGASAFLKLFESAPLLAP